MNVAKRSTVAPRALTHFEWVPGMQTTTSPAASRPSTPSNCVSSPRMTSGALGSRCAMPGRIRMSRSCPGTATACSGIDASRAGVSRYPASTHPPRAPAMPQTTTGSPGAAPTASRCDCSTAGKPGLPAAIMPSWLRRSPSTLPARSTSQSRKLLVPQSTATYAAWLISTPSRCYPRPGWYHAGLPASYARFVIDLRRRNQHDPQSCAAPLYCSVASPTRANPHKCGMATKKKNLEDAIMINLPFGSALMGFGLLIAALSPQVHAQSSPKTVTLVVPFAAGGGTDTVARLIGERMSRTLGQTVIIENVVGGGSTRPMIALPDRRLTVRRC